MSEDPSASRPHIIDAELDAVAIVKAVLDNDQDAFTAIAGGLHEVRDGALYHRPEGYLLWTLAGWLLNVMHDRYTSVPVRHTQDVRESEYLDMIRAQVDSLQRNLLARHHGLEGAE